MKITKKIVALMLSLLMVCGCIPNFSNEANADTNADAWDELVNSVDLETSFKKAANSTECRVPSATKS